MADWTVIPDASLDPDAPLTSELAYAWRDNPIALAEGAGGAPRIQDGALVTGPATTAGVTWVGRRVAFISATQIGQMVFGQAIGASGGLAYGDSFTGTVRASNSAADTGGQNFTGTWRCLGYIPSGASPMPSTFFIRTAL